MACKVLGGVLPFAVRVVGRLRDDACAVLPGALAMGVRVVHAHQHRVCNFAGARGPAIGPYIADDDGAAGMERLGFMPRYATCP